MNSENINSPLINKESKNITSSILRLKEVLGNNKKYDFVL